MTVKQLRERIFTNNLDDSWWVAIEGKTPQTVENLETVETQQTVETSQTVLSYFLVVLGSAIIIGIFFC